MKKCVSFLMVLFIPVLFFSDLRKHPPDNRPVCRVVTQVDITSVQERAQIHRRYTDPAKMEWALIWLRLCKPQYTRQPSSEHLGDIYEIRLQFSDGSHRLYRQTSHRYLSRDGGLWKAIEPSHATGLYTLMRTFPSDPEEPIS